MNRDELLKRLQQLDPLPLGVFPTPLLPLTRLSATLGGPELWIKRDDLTGLGGGGNKVRKLTFLAADALRQDADMLMTTGACQSNHARQTAAVAARLGLPCVLVLAGDAQPPQGNHLLDRLFGAEVRWAGERSPLKALYAEAESLRQTGRRPYVVPYGGSNAVGVCGYVLALAELAGQLEALDLTFDALVVASSSGGTQAGLALGARALGFSGEVLGISISERADDFRARLAQLANEAADLLSLPITLAPEDFSVSDAYLGAGYGRVSAVEREAIALAAQTEGLLVDPVYTGRALGGLIDLVRQGRFAPGARVLFWHTGGAPALYAYATELLA